jgi:ferredoxin-NADP reductase
MTEMSKSRREWTGETSVINKELLAKHLPAMQGPIYYTAGPPGMVTAMRGMLTDAGVGEADIRTEKFAGY